MINFTSPEAQLEFEKAFGMKIEDLTTEQLWWLTKFAKHCRGRCRNNSAFNNYANSLFKGARFKDVPKEYKGKPYKGLQITAKGVTKEDDSEAEDQ